MRPELMITQNDTLTVHRKINRNRRLKAIIPLRYRPFENRAQGFQCCPSWDNYIEDIMCCLNRGQMFVWSITGGENLFTIKSGQGCIK